VSFDVNQDPDRPDRSPSVDPPFRPGPRRPADVLIARLRPWLHWVGGGRIVTAAVTVLAVGAGGWWLLRTPPPPTEAGLPYAATSTTASSATTAVAAETASTEVTSSAAVVVHVAGAVSEPGVYELPSGSRVHAAIDAAGGPLPKAEPSALNLAAPLVDGERIYVPRVGEDVPVAAVDVVTSGADDAQPSGPIDVNHATVEQLDELPGIGPATADAIVDHRQQNGPFAAVDDLEAVRGIGPAKLEAIRDLVGV
jgi:competence protein ComEA